jgi:hypothetical protein
MAEASVRKPNFTMSEDEVQQALRLFAYGIEHLKGYMTATEYRITDHMQERLHTLAIDLHNAGLRRLG